MYIKNEGSGHTQLDISWEMLSFPGIIFTLFILDVSQQSKTKAWNGRERGVLQMWKGRTLVSLQYWQFLNLFGYCHLGSNFVQVFFFWGGGVMYMLLIHSYIGHILVQWFDKSLITLLFWISSCIEFSVMIYKI